MSKSTPPLRMKAHPVATPTRTGTQISWSPPASEGTSPGVKTALTEPAMSTQPAMRRRRTFRECDVGVRPKCASKSMAHSDSSPASKVCFSSASVSCAASLDGSAKHKRRSEARSVAWGAGATDQRRHPFHFVCVCGCLAHEVPWLATRPFRSHGGFSPRHAPMRMPRARLER
jgi:hypothetical protein